MIVTAPTGTGKTLAFFVAYSSESTAFEEDWSYYYGSFTRVSNTDILSYSIFICGKSIEISMLLKDD